MAWSDVSDPEAIRLAVAEYDRLGPVAFHAEYGFGPARTQVLVIGPREYPSKAIVGVAHSFQFPRSRPLRSGDFTGGEHTVKALLTKLGFVVQAPKQNRSVQHEVEHTARGVTQTSSAWDLQRGRTISRKELHDRFGGSRQGGIAPSVKTDNVLIFSDTQAGSQFGYLFDGWQGRTFHYTGEGQIGDQLMRAGNRALRDHLDKGRRLRVFEGVRDTVRYMGEFRLTQERPFFYAEAPDRDGNPRQVIVFRLIPVDAVEAPATETAERPAAPGEGDHGCANPRRRASHRLDNRSACN